MRKKKKEGRIFDGPDYVVETHDPKNDPVDADVEEFFEEIMSKDVDIDTGAVLYEDNLKYLEEVEREKERLLKEFDESFEVDLIDN